MAENNILPWQKQPGESRQAYEAFRVYKDQDPATRTVQRVCSELGKHRNLIDRWAQKWDWRERVDAWDREQERQQVEDMNQRRREMNERHLRIITAAQGKAVSRLRDLDPADLSPSLLFQYIQDTMRLERLILGEPETIEERRETIQTRENADEKIQRYSPVLQDMMRRGVLRAVPDPEGEDEAEQLPGMEEDEDVG